MQSFSLASTEGFGDSVQVTIPSNITEEQLSSFIPFKDWKSNLRQNLALQDTDTTHAFHQDPYRLRSIMIQSVDWFGPRRIGFVKLNATIQNSRPGIGLPGVAMLRGGNVAVLVILRPEQTRDERYIVMTEQPRVPTGSLRFREIPAGMLDSENGFSGAAANEIWEETGLRIPKEELIDLTELALQSSDIRDTSLKNALHPSPSLSDESIPILLWEKVSFDAAMPQLVHALMP
jgi:ADP-sugar diphosphatase